MAWYDEDLGGQSQFMKSGIGSEWTFKVKEIKKVESQGNAQREKFDLKKDNQSVGYCFHFISEDGGIYTVNNWTLLKLLKQLKVTEGQTITIKHPGHNKYEVKVESVQL